MRQITVGQDRKEQSQLPHGGKRAEAEGHASRGPRAPVKSPLVSKISQHSVPAGTRPSIHKPFGGGHLVH